MLERVLDKMEKQELIVELEKLIKSEEYDIDQLLETIPEYLLDDLKDILKKGIKENNEKDVLLK